MANVGTIDRGLRFVAGAVLMVAPLVPQAAGLFAGMGDWKYAIVAAGAVMIGTAMFRFCPAYTLFGIRTCEIGTR